jgi:hypothetical protein
MSLDSRKLLQLARLLSSRGHVAAVELIAFSQVLLCPYNNILCIFHLTVIHIQIFSMAECECECYIYKFYFVMKMKPTLKNICHVCRLCSSSLRCALRCLALPASLFRHRCSIFLLYAMHSFN